MTTKNILSIMFVFFSMELMIGQHCAPIIESWLSEINIKHKDKKLNIDIEYSKTGGQQKKAYQIYLIAYLEKNEQKVLNRPLNNSQNDSLSIILKTDIIARTETGIYPYNYNFDVNKMVEKLKRANLLKERDKEIHGGYGRFKEKFKLIVFIPFLEDKNYSTHISLPEDKHECNYAGKKALLFTPLPYSFSIHYGTVQGKKLGKGNYSIHINQKTDI
ncbi:MAG: hypothetical protein ABFS35_23395 [Bacteroidota bacterium]